MFKKHNITCILWITIGLMAIAVQAGPVDENEIQKGRECKTFCDRCGCIGFYCGEECICECNQEKNGGDTECIAAIQADAKKNRTPFEILIQGPSANRFLRNALQFEQNQQTCNAEESGRSKRSTVVIYKPAAEDLLNYDGFCERPLTKEDVVEMKKTFRAKRAIGGDSWFTDFSNTFVKPAPITGMSVDAEEIDEMIDEEEPEVEEENVVAVTEESIIPKIREIRKDIRNALNIGESESIVKGIRKTFNKIGDKALKAVELDGTVKKIRGAITTLLPDETEGGNALRTGRKIINKIRGKIFQPYGEEEEPRK
ncbi:uncharacterized protein LOC129945705 [Eupeodes corollae]|uniref:uncharacterized protein LOC129945705 n=1 Tax=Eupeodes corollae TaxID=290404 RepID=UPI002491C32B|nr:uncharacterized protein LOC129945705 [Eupeodes corollae]